MDFHNPIKHFGMIDLNNEVIEEGFIDRFREFDNRIKLRLHSRFIGVFAVGNDIDVGIGLHEA